MGKEHFYPIHLQRSDGVGYHTGCDDSEPIPHDDIRTTRWRAQLGGHLAIQLGPAADRDKYILAALPDGYELREVKEKKTDPGKEPKLSTYLYGHPYRAYSKGGKPVRVAYRIISEFVPHLMWLISDSVDRNDCSCEFCMKMCAPNENQQSSVSASGTPVPGVGSPAPHAAAQVTGRGGGQAPASQRAGNAPAQARQQQQSQQLQQPQQNIRQPQQQQARSSQQQIQARQHAQPNVAASSLSSMGISSPSNIFRVAEMVWFRDRAWRLGIILSITPKAPDTSPNSDDSHYSFVLAQLGHAGLRKPDVTKEAAEMRPFLTFSVPDSHQFQHKSFDDVKWAQEAENLKKNNTQDAAQLQHQLEVLGLEASKVAARTINNFFSTFNRQPDKAAMGSGFSKESYGSVFLGAEMVVIGDPVRVAPPPNLNIDADDKATTVMLVNEICVLTPHTRNQQPQTDLQFRGNVYLLTRQREHAIDPATAAESLGITFKEEVDFRNDLLTADDQHVHGRWTWKPVDPMALRNDDQIHGRFYVSHKLLEVLNPEQLAEAIKNRAIQGASSLLNTRQQNGGNLPYAGRRSDRRLCLGVAVAADSLVLPDGIREDFAPHAQS